jgi:hypothetical protein
MKGMQAIKRGKNPLGAYSYALAGGPIIGGNMTGLTARELAREFAQALKIREAAGKLPVGKPVWHNSLRLPAGERLSPETWCQIADDYMKKMAFTDFHQRVYVLHDHPDGQHIHIIANRVSMLAGGDLYLGQNENLRSTHIIKKLELYHNLTISPDNLEKKNDNRKFYNHVPKPHPGSFGRTTKNGVRRLSACNLAYSGKGEKRAGVLQVDVRLGGRPAEQLRWTKPARRRPTAGEVGMAERTGVPPARMRLQAAVDEACSNRPDLSEFVARLDKAGVSLIPSGKTGAPQGVSFKIDGQAFKGSDLGKAYAFKQLQGRIDFNIERDQHIIDRLRARALEEAQEEGGELVPAAPYPVATSAYKGPQRTLELAFKKEGETYLWAGRGRVALIDKGQSISVMSKADSAIRASLQLARDKGWQSVMATGTPEFRQKTCLIGREMGLQIDGYQSTPSDYAELQKRLDAKKREVKNGQNQSDDGSRRNRGSIQNQDSSGAGGVGRAPGNGADQPNRGDAGQLEREPGSGASHPGSRRNPEEIQASTANTDNPRSADLAGPSVVAGRRDSVGGIVERVNNVESLAAPIQETGYDKPANRLEQPNTARPRDYETKVNAWRAQHEALGAPAYRITLVDRDPDRIKKHGRMGLGYVLGKKTGHDIKTPAEVEASISTLRRENSRLFDIYITPIDEHNHYILVDDIHEEKAGKLSKFRADGFHPVLIQYSSADNYQAILKMPKTPGDHDFANQIFQKLNTDYGEAGIKGGVVHPFRMCGYANKKAGRRSEFTRLIETNPGAICSKTSELIRFAMENHDAEKKAKEIKKEKNRRLTAIENHNTGSLQPGANNDAVLLAYKKSFNRTLGLAKKQGLTIDLSRVDFAVAKDLIKQGYRSEQIEKAIATASPNIEQRKGQHIDDYARLTVQKAMVSPDVIEHKARAEAKQAQRSGPRL